MMATDATGEVPATGDKHARFEREALSHLDALFGLALRLTGGDEPLAEDLVQDTILRAWQAWDTYQEGTNCRAWLMTILRNQFINRYRQRKRRPASVEFAEFEERSVFMDVVEEDPEGAFFDELVDDRVIEAIQGLPEDFRIPLVLSDLEGLGYQEIAEIMEIPVGTVKSRLFRARRRLQRQLYDYARDMGYLR